MFGDKSISSSFIGQTPIEQSLCEFNKRSSSAASSKAVFKYSTDGMSNKINFVKCLQGNAACPGAGFHLALGLRFRLRGIIDIFNMNIDAPNFHANHFGDGRVTSLLDIAADFAHIDIIFKMT